MVVIPAHTGKGRLPEMLVNVWEAQPSKNSLVVRRLEEQRTHKGAEEALQSVVDDGGAAGQNWQAEQRSLKHRKRQLGGMARTSARQGNQTLPSIIFLFTFLLFSPSICTYTELFVCSIFRVVNPVMEDSRSELGAAWATSFPFCQESCLGYLWHPRPHTTTSQQRPSSHADLVLLIPMLVPCCTLGPAGEAASTKEIKPVNFYKARIKKGWG